jgi:1-acyl-sn-glycerol-3-phosphate acyltransferase
MVRLAIKIFCRKIIINKPEFLNEKGPLLLACNHPNSFLDGVILDTLFEQPLYSLVRGDAFKRSLYSRLLSSLNLLPVYRASEGAIHLASNYDTFEHCKDIFRENGIIIIFSEGKCINEWHLRPLKKGTARLAITCWNENIPLRVLPIGINYSSFRRFGKNLFINFGEMIEKKDIASVQTDGLLYQSFNTLLESRLKQLVFEIEKKDKEKQQLLLQKKPLAFRKALLAFPALVGFVTHWPLYLPVRSFTFRRTNHNDHFDSVMTGILLFTYPVYLLLLSWILFLLFHSWYVLVTLILLPFTAWAYVQLKPQLDK